MPDRAEDPVTTVSRPSGRSVGLVPLRDRRTPTGKSHRKIGPMSEQEQSVEVVVTSTYDFAARPQIGFRSEQDGKRRLTIYPDASSMRSGAFRVRVDGHSVGMVPSNGRFSLNVPPGHHRIRVRFKWFLSPVVHFDASAGATVAFRTTVPDTFTMRGFVRLLIHPMTALALERVSRDQTET